MKKKLAQLLLKSKRELRKLDPLRIKLKQSMKSSWNTQNPSNLKNEESDSSFVSLVYNMNSEKNPKDIKIQNSLVRLTNKVTELESIVFRLDKAIHDYN